MKKGILLPSAYKTIKGSAYCTRFQKYEQTNWYPVTVEKFIKNRIYTGILEQGKRRNVENIKKEEWSIKENNHEESISKDEYAKANTALEGAGEIIRIYIVADCFVEIVDNLW